MIQEPEFRWPGTSGAKDPDSYTKSPDPDSIDFLYDGAPGTEVGSFQLLLIWGLNPVYLIMTPMSMPADLSSSMCWGPGHAGIRPEVLIPSLRGKCGRKVALRAKVLSAQICRLGLQSPCTRPDHSAFCQFLSGNPRGTQD